MCDQHSFDSCEFLHQQCTCSQSPPIWGTCASACADLIDSVETVNFLSGAYRLWMNTPLPNASSYLVEWKPDTASTWRSKLVRYPNSGQQRFNIKPWFNNTIAVRVAVVDSSGNLPSCEETSIRLAARSLCRLQNSSLPGVRPTRLWFALGYQGSVGQVHFVEQWRHHKRTYASREIR